MFPIISLVEKKFSSFWPFLLLLFTLFYCFQVGGWQSGVSVCALVYVKIRDQPSVWASQHCFRKWIMNKEDLHGPQKRLIDVQQQSNRQATNEGNEEHCFTRLECPVFPHRARCLIVWKVTWEPRITSKQLLTLCTCSWMRSLLTLKDESEGCLNRELIPSVKRGGRIMTVWDGYN